MFALVTPQGIQLLSATLPVALALEALSPSLSRLKANGNYGHSCGKVLYRTVLYPTLPHAGHTRPGSTLPKILLDDAPVPHATVQGMYWSVLIPVSTDGTNSGAVQYTQARRSRPSGRIHLEMNSAAAGSCSSISSFAQPGYNAEIALL